MNSFFKVKQAQLFTYQLAFHSPLTFNGQQLTQRNGLILQLQDEQGQLSFGEIAPLPGFSCENLTQATAQIINLLENELSCLTANTDLFPSVQFALDNALCKTPITTERLRTDLVPLLQGDNNSAIKQYLDLKKPQLIKLKVARQNVQQDIHLFNQLSALNPLLMVRCDANQAWTAAQASLFFQQINCAQLDYIEEPTANFSDNLQLAKQWEIGLALDESLQQADFCYQHSAQIKAFILKPTLIGSLNKIESYINLAKQHQLHVSISSSFESIVGLAQLSHLANLYQTSCQVSLGIDTLKYFQSGLLTDKTRIKQDIQALECIWTSH